MLHKKYLDFKKRIFLYALTFIFLIGLVLLAGLYGNVKFIYNDFQTQDIQYFVTMEAGSVKVRVNILFTSPGGESVRNFSFPIRIPELSELNTPRVYYPYRIGEHTFSKNVVRWSGRLPIKGETTNIIIEYEYYSPKASIVLPINNIGSFTFKDTHLNLIIDVAEKILSFESNYDLRAVQRDFNTRFNFEGILDNRSPDLILKW